MASGDEESARGSMPCEYRTLLEDAARIEFWVVDKLGTEFRPSRRLIRATKGDVSLRCFEDPVGGWVIELAAARWGGAWVEAIVVCEAEGRSARSPAELAESVRASISAKFDRLPESAYDAAAVMNRFEARLMLSVANRLTGAV